MSESPYRKVYPRTGQLLFDGGKNSKFERSLIEDNESPDCANVVFTNGAVESRQGAQKVNTTAIGSATIDGIYSRRANDNTETMIVFCNGSAWTLGTTTFTTISSAQSVFTSGIRVAAAMQENHIFFGNGGVVPYKYNGTDFTRHGVYPPTTTCTVASQAAGVLNGDYRYKIVFVNTALVESDVGPVTSTFTAANATLRLTSIPVAPQSWGISSRRIYRNTTALSGSYYRVATISDNTTTTYDDNTADTSLSTLAPTDNGVPPNYSVCCYHQGRLFMNDPSNANFLWYSDLNTPYTVASTNFIRVGDNTSDLIKTISVYDNNILVGCEKSMWMIYMPSTDATAWLIVKIKAPYGCISPFGLWDYNNKQGFPAVLNGSFVGFAAISGNSVEPQATLLTIQTAGSDMVSERIEPDMFNVQSSYVKNISSTVFKNKAYIAVTYGSGATTNNRVYVMDFSISDLSKKQKESWVPWTGLSPAQFCIYNGGLYYGTSASTGYVYRLENSTYNDDGAAIDAYFWTKEFGGYPQELNLHKDFRYGNLLVEKLGNYYMDVYVRVDSDIGSGTAQQIDLSPGGSQWGTMVWGTDIWGGGVSQENIMLDLGTAAGKRIQFKFTNQNTVNQRFKVHYANFTYNFKGKR